MGCSRTNNVLFDKNKPWKQTHNHRIEKAEQHHVMQNGKQMPNTQCETALISGSNAITPGPQCQQVPKSTKNLTHITCYNCKKIDHYSNKCFEPQKLEKGPAY